MKKRILSVVLVALLCLTAVLGGCGETKKYDPENFISDVTNPQIVKEPITVKVFVPKHALHTSYSKMAFFTEASRITNLRFEFVEAPVDALEEKRVLAWESNEADMPDLFLFGNEVSEQIQLSRDGMLRPLDGLLEEYAPNYSALMKQYPALKTASTLNDGHIYSFGTVKNVARDLTVKQYINTSLLAEAGITSLPTTLFEYKEALIAMRGVVPISKRGEFRALGSEKLKNTRNFVMSAFGYVGTGIEVKHDGSQKVVYVPGENEYKAYLTYMNELYKEGLLDKDVFETTQNKLIEKGEAGNLGSFDYAADFLVVGASRAADYAAIGPLTSGGYAGINNTNKVWLGYPEVTATTAVIPASTPYYKEIIRFLDWCYSEYAQKLLIAGVEGTHWEWTDETQTKWVQILPEDATNVELFRGTFSPNVGTGASFYWNKEFVYKQKEPLTEQLNADSENYAQYFTEPFPASVVFTEAELLEIANIERSLDDYMQTFEINCIKGANGADIHADWADHLKTLKGLKVDRLVALYQQAYDRTFQ